MKHTLLLIAALAAAGCDANGGADPVAAAPAQCETPEAPMTFAPAEDRMVDDTPAPVASTRFSLAVPMDAAKLADLADQLFGARARALASGGGRPTSSSRRG